MGLPGLEPKAWPPAIRGKVVFLGYDGLRQNFVETPAGRLNSHRWYYYCLKSLLETVTS